MSLYLRDEPWVFFDGTLPCCKGKGYKKKIHHQRLKLRKVKIYFYLLLEKVFEKEVIKRIGFCLVGGDWVSDKKIVFNYDWKILESEFKLRLVFNEAIEEMKDFQDFKPDFSDQVNMVIKTLKKSRKNYVI